PKAGTGVGRSSLPERPKTAHGPRPAIPAVTSHLILAGAKLLRAPWVCQISPPISWRFLKKAACSDDGGHKMPRRCCRSEKAACWPDQPAFRLKPGPVAKMRPLEGR